MTEVSDSITATGEHAALRDLGGFTVGKTDPISAAKSVLRHRESAVREEVASNVALTEGISALRHEKEKLDRFLRALIDAKMLSESEALLGAEAKRSHLSMLKKISDCADIIFDRRVLPFLQPGYSGLYQVCLLAEDLGRDVEQLHGILKEHDGPHTRDIVLKIRQDLKGSTEASKRKSDAGDLGGSVVTKPVTGLLLTPARQDVAKLKKPYLVDGEPACLRLGGRVAESATLVITTRAVDLPAFVDKLPCWGFKEVTRVYLLKPPSGPELTLSDIVAVCERGKPKTRKIVDWPSNTNARALAEHLLADVDGPRVHLFAKSSTEGWESMVGDANWNNDEEPVT